jgi:hypothetical protein
MTAEEHSCCSRLENDPVLLARLWRSKYRRFGENPRRWLEIAVGISLNADTEPD